MGMGIRVVQGDESSPPRHQLKHMPDQTALCNSRNASQMLPPAGPGEVYYFAYGSNMSPSVLTDRRGVKPRASAPCKVPGFALSFNMLGFPYSEPAFASIEQASAGRWVCRGQHLPTPINGWYSAANRCSCRFMYNVSCHPTLLWQGCAVECCVMRPCLTRNGPASAVQCTLQVSQAGGSPRGAWRGAPHQRGRVAEGAAHGRSDRQQGAGVSRCAVHVLLATWACMTSLHACSYCLDAAHRGAGRCIERLLMPNIPACAGPQRVHSTRCSQAPSTAGPVQRLSGVLCTSTGRAAVLQAPR